MLTEQEFLHWYDDFKSRFPTVKDYASRQENPVNLLDTWHQTLAAFTPAVLEAVTLGIVTGEFEPIPNTNLGQFAHEIRTRAKVIVERIRRQEPQEWQRALPTWVPSNTLNDPRARWMIQCASAVDRLLHSTSTSDVRRYAFPGSVRPEYGSYDAAIVMADNHSEDEARRCCDAFRRDGLTWEQIQHEAGKSEFRSQEDIFHSQEQPEVAIIQTQTQEQKRKPVPRKPPAPITRQR